MGNSLGLPIDEINQTAARTLDTFTPAYLKAFAAALVKAEIAKKNAEPRPYALAAAPTPSEPLKEGFATKLGAVRKNWQKRYFVAMNEVSGRHFCGADSELRHFAGPCACSTGWCMLCCCTWRCMPEPVQLSLECWSSRNTRLFHAQPQHPSRGEHTRYRGQHMWLRGRLIQVVVGAAHSSCWALYH